MDQHAYDNKLLFLFLGGPICCLNDEPPQGVGHTHIHTPPLMSPVYTVCLHFPGERKATYTDGKDTVHTWGTTSYNKQKRLNIISDCFAELNCL